jgi:nicotinate-nucleotide--dimethylbenzimidazole phosphoribosyltransferase
MSSSPIEPPDERFAERARARQRELTKPPGSLGMLETIASRLASIQRQDRPTSFERRVVVFAANHGVVAEGVSPYPAEVTAQMVKNFVAGGAVINALARAAQADVVVVDVGVSPGTRNFAREPAMSEDEMHGAVERESGGTPARAEGVALRLGEMNRKHHAASAVTRPDRPSAVRVTLRNRPTRQGGGVRSKSSSARRASVSPREPLHAPFGGRSRLRPRRARSGLSLAVVVDGSPAALPSPEARPGWVSPSFTSAEPGHRALDFLGVEPLLDLGLRLGEGTGTALAMPVLGAAVAAHNEMATFADAGVSGRT